MKKIFLFVLVVVFTFLSFGCSQKKESIKVSKKILSYAENCVTYKSDEMLNNIKEIYRPFWISSQMSAYLGKFMIEDDIPIDNEISFKETTIVCYPMEENIFYMFITEYGVIECMFLTPYEMPSFDEFDKISVGMSFDEVKEIFPYAILYDDGKPYSSDKMYKNGRAFCEIAFDNAQYGIMTFYKKDGIWTISETDFGNYFGIEDETFEKIKDISKAFLHLRDDM